MEKFFKIAIGFICVVMAIAWLRIMIVPQGIAESLAMNPDGPWGLNSIRSFIGAYVLCVGVFIFLTLKKGEKQWLLVPLCLLAGSVIGRISGLVMDGFDQRIVGGIILEIILISILFGAYRKLPTKEA
jgi:hypothetical protein